VNWRPWRTIRAQRTRLAQLRACLAESREVNQALGRRITGLLDDTKAQKRMIGDLKAVVRALQEPQEPAGVTSMGLDFVLTGFDRGGGLGKRLMASRHLAKTSFGMTEMDDPPPRWQIRSTMTNMLIIDKPTYGEALDRLAEIWRNWDQKALPAQKALPNLSQGLWQFMCPEGVPLRSDGLHSDGSLCEHRRQLGGSFEQHGPDEHSPVQHAYRRDEPGAPDPV
jgi:hypothetical protein